MVHRMLAKLKIIGGKAALNVGIIDPVSGERVTLFSAQENYEKELRKECIEMISTDDGKTYSAKPNYLISKTYKDDKHIRRH